MNKATRQAVYEKFSGHCAYCGEEIAYKEMQVDHAIAQFRYNDKHDCLVVDGRKFTDYGLNDFQNLMPACRVCNKWKSTFTIEEFRHEIEMQIKRLRMYSASFRLAERYGLVSPNGNKVTFYFEKQEAQ